MPNVSYPTLQKKTARAVWFENEAGQRFAKVSKSQAKADGSQAKEFVVDGALGWYQLATNGEVTGGTDNL